METAAVDGEVAITGPGHVHGAFTPDAARASAERLMRDAEEASAHAAASDEVDPQAEPEDEA